MLRTLALLLTASTTALRVGTTAALRVGATSCARVSPQPQMMPPFLKKLGLTKPGSEEEETVTVKGPNPVIGLAGKAMSLIGPIFAAEAVVQSLVFNLGNYDEEDIQADIAQTIKKAPVVIYTYPLSPFSSEAVSVLEATGCKLEVVPLGLEWFALGPRGSAIRVELRKQYGQSSLPHVFIGGEWVGGLTTGADGGLAGLVERDELIPKLKAARAL